MNRYAILRQISPSMTRQEVDAAALETLFNMSAMNVPEEDAWEPRLTGIGWVRSYWEPGGSWGLCLYRAKDAGAVELYHRSCNVPYVEFGEVQEVSAAGRETASGRTLVPAGHELLTVEFAAAGANVDERWFVDAVCGEALTWVRAYRDQRRGRAVALYSAPDADAVQTVSDRLQRSGVVVRRVVEIHPDEYLGA